MNYPMEFLKTLATFCVEHKFLATIFFLGVMITYSYTVEIIKFAFSRRNKINGGNK